MNNTTNTVSRQRRSLTKSQVRELTAELVRESGRFGPEDPRAHAFANALRRIEHGTYGYCATCGNGIPYERLSVVPETTYCVSCCATRA